MAPRSRKTANGTASTDDSLTPSDSKTNGSSSPVRSQSAEPPITLGPLSIVIADDDRDVVKVNNASVSELKNACDDALKRVSALSPAFHLAVVVLIVFCVV